jgi:hypothetical protein
MLAAGITLALTRTNDTDPVAALTQTTDQATDGHGDAIDFRREGFGNEGDGQ